MSDDRDDDRLALDIVVAVARAACWATVWWWMTHDPLRSVGVGVGIGFSLFCLGRIVRDYQRRRGLDD